MLSCKICTFALPQTAKKTNEWVLNKAGAKRKLLDTVTVRKPTYYGHTMKKQGSCLEKGTMKGTMPGARRRGRPHTAWMDNIKTWTGLSVEESIRMTEDKWRKYIHGVGHPRIKDGRTCTFFLLWTRLEALQMDEAAAATDIVNDARGQPLTKRVKCDSKKSVDEVLCRLRHCTRLSAA